MLHAGGISISWAEKSSGFEEAGARDAAVIVYPMCAHNDPTYGNTNHGWPKFAGKMLWEHFSSF